MKKLSLSIVIVLVTALVPMAGFAAENTLEGSIQGFMCVTLGITCPVGKEDPMAAVERVFVLLTASNEYYFVPNVDRAVLARHINENIQVSGEMNAKYKSIQASSISTRRGGAWEKVWDTEGDYDPLRVFDPRYQRGRY